MANRSRFVVAKADILKYFEQNSQVLFSKKGLNQVLTSNRGIWRLAQYTTVDDFITLLEKHSPLTRISLDFGRFQKELFLYKNDGSITPEQVVLAVKQHTYLSHYSAAAYHNLTEQHPKTIYVTAEQLQTKAYGGRELTQDAIDRSFHKPQRKTQNKARYEEYMVALLDKKVSEVGKGIITDEALGIKVSSLERTLLEMVMRPAYSGGVHETLKAFVRAKEQKVSVNKMGALLSYFDLLYPYAHSVGFYLERAGYRNAQLDVFKRRLTNYRFYLTYNMQNPVFCDRWNLYHPKSI